VTTLPATGNLTQEHEIGTVSNGPHRRRGVITVQLRIEGSELGGRRLAITGEIQRRGAADIDAGGQLDRTLVEYAEGGQIQYAEGWSYDRLIRLCRVWRRWHLNDMRAECEHQRLWGWTWETNPSFPCPVCGYKLGSEWKVEELSPAVLEYISAGCP
jgi:hypothetical protein